MKKRRTIHAATVLELGTFRMRLALIDVPYDSMIMVIGFGIGVASWSSMIDDLADAFWDSSDSSI